MTLIIAHRGLDPLRKNYYIESSFEAFEDQSERGFGIEFDLNFTIDSHCIIFHDEGLKRITNAQDIRLFQEMTIDEVKAVRLGYNRLCDLSELFNLIRKSQAPINALHLKGKFQEPKYLDILLDYINKNLDLIPKIIIFDVKIETAKYLKQRVPELILAPSVAHEYDIERYNSAVKDTLLTADEAIKNKSLFDWVWLDEWDLIDINGKNKNLYNKNVFTKLRNEGMKIALVSPELHATSPSLLGGEAHPDALNMTALTKRLKKILKLHPDAICTDYPDLLKNLQVGILKKISKKILRLIEDKYEQLANPLNKNITPAQPGWSVVYITDGRVNETLNEAIASTAAELNSKDCEIIIVGPKDTDIKYIGSVPVKHIVYRESGRQHGYITRKKNIGVSHCRYDKVAICHDYIKFLPGWMEGYNKFGDNFDVCMNKITNADGKRFLDWVAWDYPSLGKSLLPYSHECDKSQVISGTYFVVKRNFYLAHPLNEKFRWSEAEDYEWSCRVRQLTKFKMNPLSEVRCIKMKKSIHPSLLKNLNLIEQAI